MANYEDAVVEKMAFLTAEQQELVLKFIEDIETKELPTRTMFYMRLGPFDHRLRAKYQDQIFGMHTTDIGDLEGLLTIYIKEKHHLLVGRPTAQKIIDDIGSVVPLLQEVTFLVKGRNLDTGLPDSLEISSIEIREQIQPPIDRVIGYIRLNFKAMLRHQGLPEAALENATIRLGGEYARIRGVVEAVQQATGLKVID